MKVGVESERSVEHKTTDGQFPESWAHDDSYSRLERFKITSREPITENSRARTGKMTNHLSLPSLVHRETQQTELSPFMHAKTNVQ